MIGISFVNHATALAQDDAKAIVSALQKQMDNDFEPVWGVPADLTLTDPGLNPAEGQWVMGFFDTADQAGALGYHDCSPEGLPLGKIFVKTTLDDGGKVSVTASHELVEMLGDPDINLTAMNGWLLYSYELADACEADELGYVIDGITVSDFVYPAYFENFRKPNSAQFDRQGKITEPFQILPGGYMGVLNLRHLHLGWQQVVNQGDHKAARASRAHIGSRRERRRTVRENWTHSTYKPGERK